MPGVPIRPLAPSALPTPSISRRVVIPHTQNLCETKTAPLVIRHAAPTPSNVLGTNSMKTIQGVINNPSTVPIAVSATDPTARAATATISSKLTDGTSTGANVAASLTNASNTSTSRVVQTRGAYTKDHIDKKLTKYSCMETNGLLSMDIKFDGDFTIGGVPMLLDVDHPCSPGETGLRAWDCGIIMAKFVEHHLEKLVNEHLHGGLQQQESNQHKLRVVELGCGSGLVGFAAALLGGNVVLTDRACIEARTRKNIHKNQESFRNVGGFANYEILDWNDTHVAAGQAADPYPVVLAADVLWETVPNKMNHR